MPSPRSALGHVSSATVSSTVIMMSDRAVIAAASLGEVLDRPGIVRENLAADMRERYGAVSISAAPTPYCVLLTALSGLRRPGSVRDAVAACRRHGVRLHDRLEDPAVRLRRPALWQALPDGA